MSNLLTLLKLITEIIPPVMLFFVMFSCQSLKKAETTEQTVETLRATSLLKP